MSYVTGSVANFFQTMMGDVRAAVTSAPNLSDLKKKFNKEVKILETARDAIQADLSERNAKRPLPTNTSQKELEKYNGDIKKLEKILEDQKNSLVKITVNQVSLANATNSNAIVVVAAKVLRDHQRTQPAPFKIMNIFKEYFQQNENFDGALRALSNIVTKSKGKPEETVLIELSKNIVALQNATEELKKITDKMVTPAAKVFYQKQKEFQLAIQKRNELLITIEAQLQSSKELLNKIFDADDKSTELSDLTKYLRVHQSISKDPSTMPILGDSDTASEIKMDLDGTCGIKQYFQDPMTKKWEEKTLLDKNGKPLQPTMKEILAAIAEADKIEQARSIPPEKFKPTKITKDFFGKSYTLKHRSKERRDEYNTVLKQIVENRLTKTPIITQANATTSAQPLTITHESTTQAP